MIPSTGMETRDPELLNDGRSTGIHRETTEHELIAREAEKYSQEHKKQPPDPKTLSGSKIKSGDDDRISRLWATQS